jgi:hypothetical protein
VGTHPDPNAAIIEGRQGLIRVLAHDAKEAAIMSTVPTRQTTDSPPPETVEQRFRRLEATWFAEVGFSSSPTEICSHWAFQEIIRMGEVVVPLMLRDLEERPRLWVWALPDITGADPVPPSDRGKIARMSEVWLRWGKEQGYKW